MRFANLEFLGLFLVFAVLYFFYRKAGSKMSGSLPFSRVKNFTDAEPAKWFKDRRILTALRIAAVSLFILGLARPQKGQRTEELITKGVDIILCIDTSTSMKALDFKPMNRMDAAKEAAKSFVKSRRYDRIGIVVFSGYSFTQCPLTLDYGAVLDFLDKVEIGMTQTDGTAIGNAIITSLNRLKDSDAATKIIILLTDGRNNAGEILPQDASRAAAALGVKIYTIGVGKTGGAIFPVEDPLFGTRYVTLQEDLDEPALRAIADNTGALYFRAENVEGLKKIYEQIDKLEKTKISVKEYTDYDDKYIFFVLLGFILLAAEIILSQTYFFKIP